MNVLLVETHVGGHGAELLRRHALALRVAGVEVSEMLVRRSEWGVALGRVWKRIRDGRFDVVHFLTVDGLGVRLLLWGLGYRWRRDFALVGTYHNLAQLNRRGKSDILISLVRCGMMQHLITFGFGRAFRRIRASSFTSLVEPLEVQAGAAAFRRRPCNRVLFFGAISREKGIDRFVRFLDESPDFVGCVAGRGRAFELVGCEGTIRKLRECGRLLWEEGFVTEMRKKELFELSDAVACPYRSEHIRSSGILRDGVSLVRPLLYSKDHWLAPFVVENGLGVAVDWNSTESVRAGVRMLRGWDEGAADVAAERFGIRQFGIALRGVYERVVSQRDWAKGEEQ